LNYTFKNTDLLEEAFRHSSYVNEKKEPGIGDNERLEFLGDAVLDLAISHILMDLFAEVKEGDLSKYRATVVNEKGLYKVARDLGLGDYLLLGKGEEMTNGRKKSSILANTVEALLGALYLDAGYEKTKDIIYTLFYPQIKGIRAKTVNYDYKSMLQEHTQEFYKSLPEYLLVEEKGLAHDKTFKVALLLDGEEISKGIGKSKKEAEQEAAREAFYCLAEEKKEIS
jgi:ribonuclease III